MDDYTDEGKERLVTLVFDPSPITSFAQRHVATLYALSERWAGYDDPDDPVLDDVGRSGWPLRARIVDWLADRLDDLGLWANRRKAARRVRGRTR